MIGCYMVAGYGVKLDIQRLVKFLKLDCDDFEEYESTMCSTDDLLSSVLHDLYNYEAKCGISLSFHCNPDYGVDEIRNSKWAVFLGSRLLDGSSFEDCHTIYKNATFVREQIAQDLNENEDALYAKVVNAINNTISHYSNLQELFLGNKESIDKFALFVMDCLKQLVAADTNFIFESYHYK